VIFSPSFFCFECSALHDSLTGHQHHRDTGIFSADPSEAIPSSHNYMTRGDYNLAFSRYRISLILLETKIFPEP